MPKCAALQLYWNHTSAWVFSCKFAAYFQNNFSSEHLWTASGFNMSPNNSNHKYFMNCFSLDNLIKQPTCVKSVSPACIDLIITNQKSLFWNHALLRPVYWTITRSITTILRKTLTRENTKTIFNRDYKSFNQSKFVD